MANHKSSEKRARQDLKRSEINRKRLSAVRTAEKKLRAAIASKDSANIPELLKAFTSRIDSAATKGVLHTKTASRKVSRLSKEVLNNK